LDAGLGQEGIRDKWKKWKKWNKWKKWKK